MEAVHDAAAHQAHQTGEALVHLRSTRGRRNALRLRFDRVLSVLHRNLAETRAARYPKKATMSLVDTIRDTLQEVLLRLAAAGALGDDGVALVSNATAWTVDRPKRAEHGDFATNVAMVLSKPAKMAPRAIAEALAKGLEGSEVIRAAEIAGPGS